MANVSANIDVQLTADTYIKLAFSLCVPIVLYVVLLVMTKEIR